MAKLPEQITYKVTHFAGKPLPEWLQRDVVTTDMKASGPRVDKDGDCYVILDTKSWYHFAWHFCCLLALVFRRIEWFCGIRPRQLFKLTESRIVIDKPESVREWHERMMRVGLDDTI